MTTLAPVTFRERNRRSGISGFAIRASTRDERREQRERDAAQPEGFGPSPSPARRPRDERVDAEHQPAGDQHGARDVGALA